MSEVRQTPIPENAMRGYDFILRQDPKNPDRWRMVFYAQDSFGRKWQTECEVSAPELCLGQEVFPHEWSDR